MAENKTKSIAQVGGMRGHRPSTLVRLAAQFPLPPSAYRAARACIASFPHVTINVHAVAETVSAAVSL